MRDLFYLTDEQRMIRDLARTVARERIAPHAARYDETETYPEESIRAIVESGLFAIWVPEEYGGTAMGALALALACEEIAYACAATGTQYLDQALGGLPILLFGDEAQKKTYLPGLASGELLSAFSLSEPGAGSDAAGLKTTAARRGDHYVLNGSKQWCTNGDHADVITVFATVDPSKRARGVTAFLVDRGTPGFEVGKKEKKLGIRASPTVALHFSDCAIPAARRLGAEGEGFRIAMATLDVTRPATGSLAVGIAQAALDAAVGYAAAVRPADRRLPGHPVHAGRHGHAHPRRPAHDPPRGPPGRRRHPRQHLRGVDGQVLGRRRRHEGGHRRRAGVRRLRLHARVPGGALHARRQDHADLRGDQPDPAAHHRQGAARGVR
jgi:alkylation response protein AidB-like acyl-CoA dehydrogenase